MTAPSKIVVYGIGAQKSGTTWLYDQLSRLEDTHFPVPKELHYWDCVRAPFLKQYRFNAYSRYYPNKPDNVRGRLKALLNAEAWEKDREAKRYRRIFDDLPNVHARYFDYLRLSDPAYSIVGDITPSYALLGRETFAEMLHMAQDVRFVFIMRDPVQRLWSGIKQRIRGELALGRLNNDWMRRSFFSALADPLHPDFLRSDYRRTITELDAAVPPERIHYTFFETLFQNGSSDIGSLSNFLDLAEDRLDIGHRVHASASSDGPESRDILLAYRVLEPVYDYIRSRFGSRVPEGWYSAPSPEIEGRNFTGTNYADP